MKEIFYIIDQYLIFKKIACITTTSNIYTLFINLKNNKLKFKSN